MASKKAKGAKNAAPVGSPSRAAAAGRFAKLGKAASRVAQSTANPAKTSKKVGVGRIAGVGNSNIRKPKNFRPNLKNRTAKSARASGGGAGSSG